VSQEASTESSGRVRALLEAAGLSKKLHVASYIYNCKQLDVKLFVELVECNIIESFSFTEI
jgi:hypothetical protein